MDHQTGIVDAVRDAFNDTQTADLKILVDGRELHAHKVPYLYKINYQDLGSSENSLSLFPYTSG